MEFGSVLLPFLHLLAFISLSFSVTFYGDSLHFMPPQRNEDGTFLVTFFNRQTGRSSCQDESSFQCVDDVCKSLEKSIVLQTDQDQTGQGLWCQSEGRTTATVQTNKTSFSLTDSGCCWVSNEGGISSWTSQAELDLGTRSDTHSFNSCPVTATVSSLRIPQNCFQRLPLLAHDPDGDRVRCRFASEDDAPSDFNLDQSTCVITSSGEVKMGVHVFEVMLEDFPTENVVLTYADSLSVLHLASDDKPEPLCKIKLQFSVQILPSIPSCEIGHNQPVFLSRTPSHGEALHATVGQSFHLYAQAQAHHASINDFQVSGPQNMSKEVKDDVLGKAEVTLSWTPQPSDLHRSVPICLTAETQQTQSEMRCVVVMVTKASFDQGKAFVECSPAKMTVVLEKASMPGIDVNFLKLRDPKCSLSSNDTHITGSMSLRTCGTELEDKGDYIVFKNEINSFELAKEIITRRKTIKISFSCQFPKSLSISSSYNLHRSDYIFTESAFGSFGFAFEIFRDGNFTDSVEASAYPVEIELMETIFIGIEADSELPNMKLFVESCKATPDDNPENSLYYNLIENGCIRDETLIVLPSEENQFNFEVQAFKFTGNFDQVYITCSVLLCEASSPFSRCAQGCLKDPSRRRRRDLGKETQSHFITQGPLQFVQHSEDTRKGNDDALPSVVVADSEPEGSVRRLRELLGSHVTTGVFAGAFLVAVLMLVVMVRFYRTRTRPDDTNALIDDDGEN